MQSVGGSEPLLIRYSPHILATSLQFKGPYSQWGKGLMELKSWMEKRGLKASGRPFALFYDNPIETPKNELRSEACFPVAARFASEGRFTFKEFPECTVAEMRHPGPPEEYTRNYGAFLEGLLKAGYTLLGPAREFFESPAANLRPGMGILIQQPTKKAE